jgi:beta-glucanase (GH16 family)
VSRLTLTIKDTGTGLYWNPTTGDWQAAWLWYDADIASTGSPSSAWSFAFDPRGTSPSGLYQATAFAWDGRGHKDPTGSRIRFSGTEQADGDDWQLLWSDEFDGASLDPHRWKAVTGAYGAPSRDQHYTTRSENVRVENGHLVLEAHDEPYGDQGHTSGMVVSNDTDEPSAGHTRGNVSWTYGRFEVRARVPDVSGMWPAFWMRPATTTYGTWPRSGEIDVLEYAGPTPRGEVNPRGRFFTSGLHTWDPSGQAPSHKHEGPVWVDEELDADFFDDFHTWAVEWEADRFRWYVDDHLFDVATRDWQAPDAPFPAPFDQPFFLTLNLQVGGWAGPVDTGALPARFEIDHVRVYG